MDLNLHILQEDLKEFSFEGVLPQGPEIRCCQVPLLLETFPDKFFDNILYILSSSVLPEQLGRFRAEGMVSLLCIGQPPAAWLRGSCNLLYTLEDLRPAALMNRVCQCFARYDQWERSLQEALDQNRDFQELARRSGTIFHNGILLHGTHFGILCCYLPPQAEESPLIRWYRREYGDKQGCMPDSERFVNLASDPAYRSAMAQREPTLYDNQLDGYPSLYYNIFLDQVFVARLLLDQILQPLTQRDAALLPVLGEYLKKKFSREQSLSYRLPQESLDTLECLLCHKLLPERRIRRFLELLHWSVEDTYFCVVFRLKDTHDALVLDSLALQLTSLLNSGCYLVRDQEIIHVFNLTHRETTPNQLFSDILPTLRDSLLCASCSNRFHDFKNLYYFYRQAVDAWELGRRLDPSRWYFRFGDYQLDQYLARCRGSDPLEALIPEGLQALLDYDRKKHYDYTGLLRLYLDHERSIAGTLRSIYMHRNTFLYRIQRIREILNMDLDDPNVRLTLQLAFRILDQAPKE